LLSIDNRLTYIPVPEGEFKCKLDDAIGKNSILDFTVHESDDLLKQTCNMFTTYSNSVQGIADIILKSCGKDYPDNILICAREYIIACLRARLTEEISDTSSRDEYMRKYNAKRKNFSKISDSMVDILIDGDNCVLYDSCGQISFQKNKIAECLQPILDEKRKSKLEVGAYVVLKDGHEKYGVVEYKSGGYGFVGGRVENGENLSRGLEREISEEIGINVNTDTLEFIPEYYQFERESKNSAIFISS